MTDAYEYESLRKTYKNFTTPAVKFKIGGTDVIQKKELQVLSVETTLSLNSAGSAGSSWAAAMIIKTVLLIKR